MVRSIGLMTIALCVALCLSIGLCLSSSAIPGTDLSEKDADLIREAAANLVSADPAVKQTALNALNEYGEAAIPLLVEIVQANRNESSFIGLELVAFAERLGNLGLPVIGQGLSDPNPATRTRSTRAVASLGTRAAGIVDDVARLAGDIHENTDIRSQAVDALKAVGVVNTEVTQALARALTGDAMLAWRATQAANALRLRYDDLLSALFDELASSENRFPTLLAISRHLSKASDPAGLLRAALAHPSDALQRNLYLLVSASYPGLTAHTQSLSQLLLEVARTGSDTLREQAVYCLGELSSRDAAIAAELMAMASDPDVSSETKLMLACALEKSSPEDQGAIEFFIEVLLDDDSTEQLKLAAVRYLEKSGSNACPQLFVLFDHLENFSEEVLKRLSPLFYHAAREEVAVVEKLKELAGGDRPELVRDFGGRLLSALGLEAAPAQSAVPAGSPPIDVPAFLGAEGYGRFTVGGRGGKVYVVTNLSDKGPGSLRAAVEASGPRTVVFAVAGNILLEKPLSIDNPFITIAGQTAPGEGITIAGAPLNINADQVVIRYVRFRLGDYNRFESDAVGGRNVSDIILDHVSASWSVDETVSFYLTKNLTLQWSFITESLRGSVHVKGNHGYGGIWGGASSFHHNLMAHHSSRTPRFDGERGLSDPAVDMRNNVIYNWGFNSAYGGEGGNHNIVANYYKAGPGTQSGRVRHRIVEVSNGGKWYVADNYVDGYPNVSADNWAGGVQPRLDRIEDVRSDTEFPVPQVTTHSAEEAYGLVLAHAGASLPARDPIDRRIVEEVRTGTATYGGATTGLRGGIIDTQEDVGGLPFLRSHSAHLDSDEDGIPDWWAIEHGFSPCGGIDHAGDLDCDGYTNLEEYLNGTDPLMPDIAGLLEWLLVADDETRISAENQLMAMGDAAIPALEQVLLNQSEDTRVLRGILVRLMGKSGNPQGIPALLSTVATGNDGFVRAGAVDSLARIGSATPEVIGALRAALLDSSEEVQIAAADALGRFGEAASDAAIDLLLLSGSSNTRFAWKCRTAAMKVSPGIIPVKGDTVAKLIARLLSPEWQDLAITVLASNSSGSLSRVLELIMDPGEKVALRVPALRVLQRVGLSNEDVVRDVLALGLADEEPLLVRAAAINVLKSVDVAKYPALAGEIERAVSLDPLAAYLSDGRIPIKVESFSDVDRSSVCVKALIGFPEDCEVQTGASLVVLDQHGTPVYSQYSPLSSWDPEETRMRTAFIIFYPDLAAHEQAVYWVDLSACSSGSDGPDALEGGAIPAKPLSIDTSGQTRVSVPAKGLPVISRTKLEAGEGWVVQLIVNADGTGDFTTVQAAIGSVPDNNRDRVIIFVEEGVYHEKILIPEGKAMISLIGESREATILDFNETPKIQHSPDYLFNTWGSASTIVLADDLTAENITFRNSALIGTGQAPALRLEGDRMSFSNCRFVSHQDTLYANGSGRQYFHQCHVEGDVDFIYGSATAVFEDCDIVNVRKTGGYITAASTPEDREFGYVFINCRIIGDVDPDTVWLGRPWRPYSHTAYIDCYMSEVVQPTGWHNWGKVTNEATARYYEYNSYGPGANPQGRVVWSRQLTDSEAAKYTAENILRGNDGWNPAAGR